MPRDEYYDEEYYPPQKEEGFQAFVNEQLKRAPWWLISIGCHVLLGLVMWMMAFSTYEVEEEVEIQTKIEQKAEEEVEEEIERDVFENDKEINTDEPPIEDPVLKDAEISDHNETDNNEDYESSKGQEDAISDKPFQGKYWNSAIGIGGGAGGCFGGRFGGKRNLRAYGGGRRTESAVLMGLVWLKNHQNPNGMWSTDKFMTNCKKGTCTGPGSTSEYDMGNTGTALLAFLGAGHTHKHGKFKRTVKNALKAVKDRQLPNGCFGKQSGDGHWIYNHLITTMAISEAYGLSHKTPLLHSMAQKGVDYLIECQNPYLGWRYGCKPGDNDTSCTGWAVLALKSAKLSGLTVPKEAFEGARNWMDKVTDETYYKAGYTTKGDSGARLASAKNFQPLEAMTAAAVVSRVFMGASSKNPKILGGGSLMKQALPKWDVQAGTIDMYYWYYGSLAMFQLGGSFWKAWNPAMKSALVPTQLRKGCPNGSWDPAGAWGEAGGRVYSTAINVLSLEIYYRYGRVLGKK
jgi:hypothetical protein